MNNLHSVKVPTRYNVELDVIPCLMVHTLYNFDISLHYPYRHHVDTSVDITKKQLKP